MWNHPGASAGGSTEIESLSAAGTRLVSKEPPEAMLPITPVVERNLKESAHGKKTKPVIIQQVRCH
jgi:hypothetical protein